MLVACTTAPAQLKEFKSLASFLHQQSDDCVTVLLEVLYSMHTYCVSHHSLQRATGRHIIIVDVKC